MNTDRIVKQIVLHAPVERVWQAISQAENFGRWFGAAFDGPFVEGTRVNGRIVPTTVDEELARLQKPHEGTPMQWWIERIEPMRRFSFRWHPYAIERDADYSKEPTTLITFDLEAVDEGTRLTVTESGFDQIPLARRAEAFQSNDGGWAHQMRMIEKYLALPAQR